MSYDMKHRPGTESIHTDKTDDPTDRTDPTDRPDITDPDATDSDATDSDRIDADRADSDQLDTDRTDPVAVRAEETDVDETDVDETGKDATGKDATGSDETEADEARAEEIRAGDTTTDEARFGGATTDEPRTDEATDEDVEKARADKTLAGAPGDETPGDEARPYASGDGDREATDLTEAVRAEAEADRPEHAAATTGRDTEPVGQPWAGAQATPEASTVGLPGATGDTTDTTTDDERAIGRASVDTTGADEAWNDDLIDDYRLRWREIQIDFVDDPSVAVRRAEDLIEEVVQAWTNSLQANRSSLQSWRDDDRADTERLRLTLRGYRELLDRLCG